MKLKNSNGFTLAEVLITLGIIGIVAAMTMPSLINKNKEKELVNRTKKLYSNIQNAVLLSQTEAGVVGDNSVFFDVTKSSAEIANNFSKFFNGSKVCTSSSQKGCSTYYYQAKYATKYSGSGTSLLSTTMNHPKIILNDGSIIAVQQMTSCYRVNPDDCLQDSTGSCVLDEDGNKTPRTTTSLVCAYLYIDVNGVKRPNQFGADMYQVGITSEKVLAGTWGPWGGTSFKNILTGNGKLVYSNYTVGSKKE